MCVKKRGRKPLFKIPFKIATKEYQRALYLCHKHNVRDYDVALSTENGDDNIVRHEQSNDAKLPHWKEIIRQTVNPTHTPRIKESE